LKGCYKNILLDGRSVEIRCDISPLEIKNISRIVEGGRCIDLHNVFLMHCSAG